MCASISKSMMEQLHKLLATKVERNSGGYDSYLGEGSRHVDSNIAEEVRQLVTV